jgi:TolB-like protein/class 3 adenylate cyclase/predicted Zn-dependent protease
VEEERVQRRLAAILAADVAGYSRLTGVDEEGTIARLRALRRELIDPTIASHRGRIVKTTGDGFLIEFSSVVDAVRYGIELQRGMSTRNSDVPADRRIEFRIGIHLGDVVVEGDDLLGDGVNVAARLEGIAAPGGICISEDAYRQVRGKIEAEFSDQDERQLKNIAYPVRGFTWARDNRAIISKHLETPAPALTPRLSIVVLPFINLSGDPHQEYFADAITEDVTTELSRISGSFVIARNSAFTYKGRAVDVKNVGRELGVRYVLEGSVRRGGDRVRVTGQLIDAESGAHIWSDRFDYEVVALSELQDEITARLAHALDLQLIEAEGRRSRTRPATTLDALDISMQGRAILNRPHSKRNDEEARKLFHEALRLEPENVGALVGLARCNLLDVGSMWTEDRALLLAEAEEALSKALRLSPEYAWAWYHRAQLGMLRRRIPEALIAFDTAITLNPNLAVAHGGTGEAKRRSGHPEETFVHIQKAIRLSPRDPYIWLWLFSCGAAHFNLGHYGNAVQELRRSIQASPMAAPPYAYLAAALVLEGRDAEAKTAMSDYLKINPNFTVAKYREQIELNTGSAAYLKMSERLFEGLRKAGMPEE